MEEKKQMRWHRERTRRKRKDRKGKKCRRENRKREEETTERYMREEGWQKEEVGLSGFGKGKWPTSQPLSEARLTTWRCAEGDKKDHFLAFFEDIYGCCTFARLGDKLFCTQQLAVARMEQSQAPIIRCGDVSSVKNSKSFVSKYALF